MLNWLQRPRRVDRVPERASTALRTPWSETHYDRADTLPDIDGYTPEPEVRTPLHPDRDFRSIVIAFSGPS